MADLIKQNDSLNSGREKINRSIEQSERAENVANQSVDDAYYAKEKADSTQKQLEQVVIEGDSSVEAAQARVDATGGTHNTLKERVDAQQIIVSQNAPSNSIIWYEDRGESGLEAGTGSGVNIANAIVSNDEIDDTSKLWFDK